MQGAYNRNLGMKRLYSGVETPAGVGSGVKAGGACTELNSQKTDNDYEYLGNDDTARYMGTFYTPTSNQSVCKVDFKLGATGDITAQTYYAEIWTTGAGDPAVLSSVVANGTSVGVSGGAWGAGTVVSFTFSTPPGLTSGTKYAITASNHTTDAAKYSRIRYITTSDPWGYGDGTMHRWGTDLTANGSYNYAPYIVVYTVQ